jgi:nitrite reductase/ring-hydroxylating ferredoxin subunit
MGERIRIASRGEIPEGSGRSIEVGGRKVALFHLDGAFHAIAGECIHQGAPLGEGKLEGRTVVCPWHEWRFDVITGASESIPGARQEVLPVEVEGDDIYVVI